MLKKFSAKQKRTLAIVLASAMVISALAIGLGSTLASKPPVIGDFTLQPNNYRDVEVGKAFNYVLIGAAYAASSQTSIATVPNTNFYGSDVIVTGVSAGVAVISVGSTMGLVRATNFQVWDNRNIVKYSIPNNAEVFFSRPDGSTKPSPVTIETGVTGSGAAAANAAAFAEITWNSQQAEIADVDPTSGAITANSNNRKGAAIIQGTFIDKWGNRQTMNILVGVETSLGDQAIDDLLKALAKGKEIQDDADENPEKYVDSGIDDLNDAVTAGEAALNDPNADKQKAADDIWDAILELQRRLRKNKLEDAIRRGEEILDAVAAGEVYYEDDLLQELEDAVNAGKVILADPNATDDECNAAADDILDVIMKMIGGGNPDIIIGDDGSWYRRLGRPPNVYEVLDDDKQSKYPPEYIYNDGDKPGNGNDKPVRGPRNGTFYVEDPPGSNIYKLVDNNGEIQDEGAIWGGPNKDFGADDNLPAVRNETNGKWYAYLGQNVYQEIDSDPANLTYGLLIGYPFGAGEDEIPGPGDEIGPDLLAIFQNRPYRDGKFYAGPFVTSANGTYWIGDRPTWDNLGGDGMLNTSGGSIGANELSRNTGHGDIADSDQIWYMNANGDMVSTRVNYNVSRVDISPKTIDRPRGSGFQFTAVATGAVTTPQVFIWEIISPHHPGTVISENGMLAISPNETADVLTIRATSVVAANRFDTATVNVKPELIELIEATIDKIATGRSSFLIKDNATLWSTGLNGRGQLGLNDTRERRAYTPVPNPTTNMRFKVVSGFTYGTEGHSLGLTLDGTLYTWGYNNRGQLGNGGTNNRSIPTRTSLGEGTKFIAVSAGRNASAAIDTEGRLYTWGWNSEGQGGHGHTNTRITVPTMINTGSVKFQAVSAGDRCTYAITYEGVDADGKNLPGRLYAWGNNGNGRLGTGDSNTSRRTTPTQVAVGNSTEPIVKMVSGRSLGHVLVLTAQGHLYSCGANGYGQLGNGTTTSRSLLNARVGTLVYESIVSGHWHSLAITSNGDLFAWGRNNYGQVGNGNTTNQRAPVWINEFGLKYKAMAAGEVTTMAVSEQGRLYLWGRNNYGQFGNGMTLNSNRPLLVPLA